MAERCPNCGNAALDENSLFCNKCGLRLPESPPKVVVSPARRTAVVPAPPSAVVRRMAAPSPSGYEPEGSPLKRILRFDALVTKKFVPVIYVIGAFAITLLALLSLIGGSSAATTTTKTATAAASSSDTSSFVFWILVLVVGNIVWRFACEAAAATFRIHDSLGHPDEIPDLTDPIDTGYSPGMAVPEPAPVEQVKCPHCSSIVSSDQLRECEYCGVTGCERCIKTVGLVKKHLSCRDCFESHR